MISYGLKMTAIVGLAIALSGCTTNANDKGTGTNVDTNTGIQQQSISNNRTGVASKGWDNSRNNNFTPMHNNTKMEVSNKVADAISNMDEVDSATVLLTNHNAYVAVILDNGRGYGASKVGRNVGKTNMKRSSNDMIPNAMGNNATTDPLGRSGPGSGDEGITEGLKAEIAKKVRSVEPNVEHVYVSANADFVGRMRGYGERFQNGQPIRGMIIEFNTLVKRIFPKAE